MIFLMFIFIIFNKYIDYIKKTLRKLCFYIKKR